jgi:hypothetical protein
VEGKWLIIYGNISHALRFKAPVTVAPPCGPPPQGVAPVQGKNPQIRRFSGIAYSGDLISGHFFWGTLVFELDSLKLPEKLPMLIEHDRNQRAGWADTFTLNHARGLELSGVLFDTAHGRLLADEADQGFPWQISVHIEPGRLEEVAAGTQVGLNGRNFQGPLTIFRDAFTPRMRGVDSKGGG